jgi:hypothetical protein
MSSKKQNAQALREARQALTEFNESEIDQHGWGNVPDSNKGEALTKAVVDAEQNVPWYRRL